MIRKKRVNEWTEHDLDQYVDSWFDGFASSTDFETMDRIASGRVPVTILQDCLDSLAEDYGIGEYKVSLYRNDIKKHIIELAEEDLEKWDDYEDEDDEEFDESVSRRRAIKSLKESRDNIRDSIARKMDGNVWDHRSLRDYDFYYNKNNGNLIIVSTLGDKVSIAQVGEGDVKWNHLRSRADINKYFSNSESSWVRDIRVS